MSVKDGKVLKWKRRENGLKKGGRAGGSDGCIEGSMDRERQG